MARPLRLEYAGAVYHITSRGNAKQAIFCDDIDRQAFLAIVGSTVKRFGWTVYAYCLMGNHYHLLVETPVPNLSRGMRHLNGLYTQRFNRRHGRVGHVLQGRFGAILVERETYLLELVRYIALNPIRAGIASGPEKWRWSSYRAHAALATTQLFTERLRALLEERSISAEVPRTERLAARPALEALLPSGESPDRERRNTAIADAYLKHGYTLAEIARHLGLHYSTVSRIAQASTPQFKT